jgi:hypothetical protein
MVWVAGDSSPLYPAGQSPVMNVVSRRSRIWDEYFDLELDTSIFLLYMYHGTTLPVCLMVKNGCCCALKFKIVQKSFLNLLKVL